jgi:hypothetical protein
MIVGQLDRPGPPAGQGLTHPGLKLAGWSLVVVAARPGVGDQADCSPASIPLTSARQVIGPTMPSTASCNACWKPRTAASVWGPKIPSTVTLWPRADEVGASLKWATAKVERSSQCANGDRTQGRQRQAERGGDFKEPPPF